MRSIPLMAATTVILAAAWACGGDGGGVGPNTPVANFSQQCTDLACTFTDASTPAGQLSWAWDFGDPNSGAASNTASIQNPTHTFSAAGVYQVKLTVTLTSSGATNSKTTPVTVTAPANPEPTASFSVPACGTGVACQFTSTSSDVAPGTITATHWNFGDASSATNEADGVTVSHTYAAAATYTVSLTVTDDGGATNTTSQPVTVLRSAASDCPADPLSAASLNCSLIMAQKSQVKITLASHDCQLRQNRVTIQQPTKQTAFSNICFLPPEPQDYTVLDINGAAATFQPGAEMPVRFTRGEPGPTDPTPGPPRARIEGSFPSWKITIDDGGDPTGRNEPDFNDVILNVQATVVP
jgi:PKD repeat protein